MILLQVGAPPAPAPVAPPTTLPTPVGGTTALGLGEAIAIGATVAVVTSLVVVRIIRWWWPPYPPKRDKDDGCVWKLCTKVTGVSSVVQRFETPDSVRTITKCLYSCFPVNGGPPDTHWIIVESIECPKSVKIKVCPGTGIEETIFD
jgi:hypothetical protein